MWGNSPINNAICVPMHCGTGHKLFGNIWKSSNNLRKSSDIFGNVRKSSEHLRKSSYSKDKILNAFDSGKVGMYSSHVYGHNMKTIWLIYLSAHIFSLLAMLYKNGGNDKPSEWHKNWIKYTVQIPEIIWKFYAQDLQPFPTRCQTAFLLLFRCRHK